MNDEGKFIYKYSAERQQEIELIRKKYSEIEDSKLDELRRLDKSADNAGATVSLIMGVFGTLLFGFGMCCTLQWGNNLFAAGIVMGVLGLIILGAAYPINNFMVKRKRQKLAPLILKLTDEILKKGGNIT